MNRREFLKDLFLVPVALYTLPALPETTSLPAVIRPEYSLVIVGGALYVSGQVTSYGPGHYSSAQIATWNGNAWAQLR